MLTLLTAEEITAVNIKDKIKAVFRPYSITADIRRSGDISIMNINYRSRRGRIRFDKIYDLCIGKRKTLLCSRDIDLDGTYFRRFDDREFRTILMGNFICSVLEKADTPPSCLSICYYDPHAEYPSLLGRLTQFSDLITVISDMPRFYENEADRIAVENGAAVSVSNSAENLRSSDILIAPTLIEKNLPLSPETTVFTVAEPSVPCKGTVITDYHASLMQEYSQLRNDNFHDEYIMAAIYSLCGKKELAQTVPSSCSNNTDIFTLEGAVRLIKSGCIKN